MLDFDGAAFTPTSQVVNLFNPANALSYTDNSPTLVVAGQYYVDFTTATTDLSGLWLLVWTATDGTVTGVGKLKIFIDDPPI
jgi:hypothetical protein